MISNKIYSDLTGAIVSVLFERFQAFNFTKMVVIASNDTSTKNNTAIVYAFIPVSILILIFTLTERTLAFITSIRAI